MEIKPEYIQRATIEDNEDKSGIDSIIQLQYMGSTEFENHILPDSLKNIRKKHNDYIFKTIKVFTKKITVFCNKSQEQYIKTYIKGLAHNNFRLKEYSDFNNYMKNDTVNDTDFWWDIGNDIMFWENNGTFLTKFKDKIIKK